MICCNAASADFPYFSSTTTAGFPVCGSGRKTEVVRVFQASQKLLEDTLRGDEASVARALDRAHTEVASILTYNDENSLACAVQLAFNHTSVRLLPVFPVIVYPHQQDFARKTRKRLRIIPVFDLLQRGFRHPVFIKHIAHRFLRPTAGEIDML